MTQDELNKILNILKRAGECFMRQSERNEEPQTAFAMYNAMFLRLLKEEVASELMFPVSANFLIALAMTVSAIENNKGNEK